MKINNFRDERSNISAKKASLIQTPERTHTHTHPRTNQDKQHCFQH